MNFQIGRCPVCGHAYATNTNRDFRCRLCLSHWEYDTDVPVVTVKNEFAFNITEVAHAAIVPLDDGTPSFGDGRQCVDVLFDDDCAGCWVIDGISVANRDGDLVIDVEANDDVRYYFRVPVAVVRDCGLDYDAAVAAIVALTLSVKGVEPDSFC